VPDLFCDVDADVILPVNILPLLDSTDFKTIEDAVAYNAAGLVLTWNFVTTAGVATGTAITPTTGGVFDWSEPLADVGMYAIEMPASGQAAGSNNDREGVGWFTGVATGVLPWRGPTIGFRAAALNNSLIDGATLDVNVTAISGDTTAADNAELMFDGTGYAGGATKMGVDLVAILGTALTETAGLLAGGFKKFFNVASPTGTLNSLPDAVPDAAGGLPVTGTRLTAIPWNAAWDAEVESEANDALVANNLDHVALTATGIPAIPAGTYLDQMMDDGTAVYDRTTDSLQAIRDRGDAAWDTADVSALALQASVDDLEGRLTAARAGYLDNLSGGAVALQSSVDTLEAGVTVTTNNDKTGYALSTAGILAIWHQLTAAVVTASTMGKLIVDYLDAAITSRLATSGYTAPPTVTQVRTEMDSNSTQLAAIVADTSEVQAELADGGRTDLLIDGIAAKTTNLPASPAAVGSAMTLATDAVSSDAVSAAGANKVADHILRRTFANVRASANGDAVSFRSLLGAIAKLVNKLSVAGSTLTVTAEDDTTALGTQTVTSDATADPITGLDTN
jgi:hypothetical protein